MYEGEITFVHSPTFSQNENSLKWDLVVFVQDGQSVVHIAASEGKLDCLKVIVELENVVELFIMQDKDFIINKRLASAFLINVYYKTILI